jgi:hypothetical protein
MSKCIFDELPTWKKIRLKKERSFFWSFIVVLWLLLVCTTFFILLFVNRYVLSNYILVDYKAAFYLFLMQHDQSPIGDAQLVNAPILERSIWQISSDYDRNLVCPRMSSYRHIDDQQTNLSSLRAISSGSVSPSNSTITGAPIL